MATNRRSSSSSGGGSTGGGSNLIGGGGLSSEEIRKKLNSIDPTRQFEEYERLILELEEAERREAEGNTTTPNQGDPGETPPPPATTPPSDGSGVRNDLGNGWSYEYDTGSDPATATITIYSPDGQQYDRQTNIDVNSIGQNGVGDLGQWYTDQLNNNVTNWNDPNYYNENGFDPTGGVDPSQTTQTPTSTSGDPLSDTKVTLPDGSEYDFSLGNYNKSYDNLDNKVDALIDSYENAEGDEQKALYNRLQEVDKTLLESAEKMRDMSKLQMQMLESEVAKNKDMLDEYNSDSTSQERKEELNSLIGLSNQNIANLQDGWTKTTALADSFNKDIGEKIDKAVNEGDDGDLLEDAKSFLTWTSIGLLALGTGVDLYETWFGDGDDIDTASPTETMAANIQAIKDNFGDVLDVQEQYQGQINELENLSNYGKLFGTNPVNDLFNSDPKYQEGYNAYLNGPDGIPDSGDEPANPLSESDWLQKQIDADPNGEYAQDFADSVSRVGTTERLLERQMNNAKNVYLPESEGGMGFTEDDFRTRDQRKTMKLANELIDSPVNDMLEDSVMSELAKGGDMGQEYYTNQKNTILGGMAPSLAKQGGLLSGGVQQLARQMTGDYQRTLNNRQNQAMAYQNQRGNQLTNFSNLANANTVSPTSLFGLQSGSSQVGSTYQQASQPTGSQFLADPTTAFAGASGQQALMNSLLNYASQDSLNTKITNTANSANTIVDLLDKVQTLNNKEG